MALYEYMSSNHASLEPVSVRSNNRLLALGILQTKSIDVSMSNVMCFIVYLKSIAKPFTTVLIYCEIISRCGTGSSRSDTEDHPPFRFMTGF